MTKLQNNLFFIKNFCDKRQLIIGTCESITAGLVANNLTAIPGSSSFFSGGLITYHSSLKTKLLNINNIDIISFKCSDLMAKNAADILNADIVIATTGNAGPTLLENKPLGMVFFSIYFKSTNTLVNTEIIFAKNDRHKIQQAAAKYAIQFLTQFLKNLPNLN